MEKEDFHVIPTLKLFRVDSETCGKPAENTVHSIPTVGIIRTTLRDKQHDGPVGGLGGSRNNFLNRSE